MIRAIVIVYWSFIVMFIVLFVSQVLIPIGKGTRVFPIARKRVRTMEGKLTEARENVEHVKRTKELKELQNRR